MKTTLILDLGHAEYGSMVDIQYGIEALAQANSFSHEVILKFQYFTEEEVPGKRRWRAEQLQALFSMANDNGFQATTSVFGLTSLTSLILGEPELPFIKIAGDSKYHRLIGQIPRRYPILTSVTSKNEYRRLHEAYPDISFMCTVKQYPATVLQYIQTFPAYYLKELGVSDHTEDAAFFESNRQRKPSSSWGRCSHEVDTWEWAVVQ